MRSVCHTVDGNLPKLAFQVEQSRIGRPGQLTAAVHVKLTCVVLFTRLPAPGYQRSTLGLQPTRLAPWHAYMATFVWTLRGRHSYSGYTTHLIRICLRG